MAVERLARALVGGEPAVDAIVSRASRTFGREFRWFRTLAIRYLKHFSPGDRRPQPRTREVVAFLWNDERTQAALRRHGHRLKIAEWVGDTPTMQPVAAARPWPIPSLVTVESLAQWLHLSVAELAWFSDAKGLERSAAEALRHYRYRLARKRSGSLRLIEAPKQRLKTMQRQVLDELLTAVPVHPAVHGFVAGRSIRGFAEPHGGQAVVLRLDLRDFFPSITGARVRTLFRTLGYPEHVADLLGGLSVHRPPHAILRRLLRELYGPAPVDLAEAAAARDLKRLYGRPHLPQGAPTSPALANACFHRTDCRLAGLARAAGAAYTRYADDLAFSGDATFARGAERFAAEVAVIVAEAGFAVNHRKTRIMRQGVRQKLAGLTVNAHPNVDRREFDRLKAILTNCVRRGPAAQNRDHRPEFRAYLAGCVSFVASVNPARGERLRAILEEIQWEPTE